MIVGIRIVGVFEFFDARQPPVPVFLFLGIVENLPIAGFGAMVLIATTFPVGDMITDAIEPTVLQSLRFVMASLIFAPFVIARVGLPWPGFSGLARYGAIAAAMDAFFWSMYEGLRTTDSLNTAVISTTQGIVTAKTIGKKADGTVFMTYERTFLVPKRGHAVDDVADY